MSHRTLLPLLLALVSGKLALDHISDPDLFWHLRLGLDALAGGRIPTTAEYAWTLAGRAYLANDWLAEVLLASVYRLGGVPLVALAKALLAALLSLLLYLASLERSEGHAPAAGLAALVGVFVAATNFATRPVLLGMVCFAAVLWACERVAKRGDRKALLALPVLFALWLNLHGSWPIGIAAVGALAVSGLIPARWSGSRLRRPGSLAAARWALPVSVLGLLANPVGLALWVRPFKFLGAHQYFQVFDEGAPVPVSDPSFWILAGTGLLLVWTTWRSRLRPCLAELALIGGAGLLALTSALHHAVFGLVVVPYLAERLAEHLPAEVLRRRGLNGAVAGVAVATLLPICAVHVVSWRQDVARRIPLEAIEALEESGVVAERGFNYFDWGGYLAFRRIPTFVDGRLEPFIDAGVFDRYLRIEREGDVAELERLGVRWLLLRRGTNLSDSTRRAQRWKLLFEDELAEVWTL